MRINNESVSLVVYGMPCVCCIATRNNAESAARKLVLIDRCTYNYTGLCGLRESTPARSVSNVSGDKVKVGPTSITPISPSLVYPRLPFFSC